MIRLISRCFQSFGSRKQNFFELNPVYPDYGQKDFDIYNVQRKRITTWNAATPIRKRQKTIMKQVKEHYFMRKYKLKYLKKKAGHQQFDDESGLPIDINADYDSFILTYKKNKRLSNKIQFEFKNVLMSLIQKFKVKSQFELIKLFRISLAHSKKDSLKQQIRGKLMQEAIIKASETKNDFFSDFYVNESIINKKDGTQQNQISEEQLNETAFQQALKQIDQKIQQVERKLKQKKLKEESFYDQVYGQKIVQQVQQNSNYDMNLKRGFLSKIVVNQNNLSPKQSQNQYIRKRINKLFFMHKLQYLKKDSKKSLLPQDLPILIRQKDKVINELAYKYKQYDLMVEPNLKQIYQQIDLAFNKINVKYSPDLYGKQNKQKNQKQDDRGYAVQKAYRSDELLWNNLNVQKVFTSDYYVKQNLVKQAMDQKQLMFVTPSAGGQLSLARAPFNLHRHSECQIFSVFTKQKHMILKDFLKQTQINMQYNFDFFSLQEASDQLKKIKRQPYNQDQRYYGHAKRKKSEAEVFLKPGIGNVTINKIKIKDYFPDTYYRVQTLKPLMFAQAGGKYDLDFNVVGGGLHGQSQCMAYALARALMKINSDHKRVLYQAGLGGYDSRQRQPKRMGLYSARVRPPFVRR